MAENSKIEWTDHTFNPVTGCTKVSPACDLCYAEGWAKRSGIVEWGPGKLRRRTSADLWRKPVQWNRSQLCRACGTAIPVTREEKAPCPACGCVTYRRPRVFSASLADWLDHEWAIDDFADFLILIHDLRNLNWQLLTKRPGGFRSRIRAAIHHLHQTETRPDVAQWLTDWINEDLVPDHLWIGVTAENQKYANKRIPQLWDIPAAVRFLSCEPLLGSIDIPDKHIDWVITGGESSGFKNGSVKTRPMHPHWVAHLQQQCHTAGIPFFFKQWGDWHPADERDSHPEHRLRTLKLEGGHMPVQVACIGKHAAGSLLNDHRHQAFPATA